MSIRQVSTLQQLCFLTHLSSLFSGGDLCTALAEDHEHDLRWYNKGHLIALDIARGLFFLHSHDVRNPLTDPPADGAECPTHLMPHRDHNVAQSSGDLSLRCVPPMHVRGCCSPTS